MAHSSTPPITPLDDRVQRYLLRALRASVAVAIGLAVYQHDWGALLYSLLALVLMFLPELIKSRAKIHLPIEYDVVLVIFIYAAQFLGEVHGAYERFWWWDAVLHVGSGFILAFVAFLILYINVQRGKIHGSKLLIGAIIFSFALAAGALWEIYEYAFDSLFDGHMQRSGLQDTMWDLIVDSLGALVMAWIGVRHIFGKPRGFIARWTKNFIKANPVLGAKTK